MTIKELQGIIDQEAEKAQRENFWIRISASEVKAFVFPVVSLDISIMTDKDIKGAVATMVIPTTEDCARSEINDIINSAMKSIESEG